MGRMSNRFHSAFRRHYVLLAGSVFALVVGVLFYMLTQYWIESDARKRFAKHALIAQSNLEARVKSYNDLLRAAGSMVRANAPISRSTFQSYVAGLSLSQQYPAVEVLNVSEFVRDQDREQFEQRLRKDYASEIDAGLSVAIQPPGRRPAYCILTFAAPLLVAKTVGLDLLMRAGIDDAYQHMIDNGTLAHSGLPISAITEPNHTVLGLRLPLYRLNMPANTVAERRAAYMGSVGIAFSVPKLVRGILGEMRIKNVRMTLIDVSTGVVARSLPVLDGGRVLFDSSATDRQPAPALDTDPDRYFSESVMTNFHGRQWKVVFSTSKRDFYMQFDAWFPLLAMLAGMISAGLLFALFYTLTSAKERALAIAEDMTRELRDSEFRLKRSHDQLRRLAAHADQIKEDERKRIAREIHDELGQNLLVLRIEADMLSSRTSIRHPLLHHRARRTVSHIDATIRSVRQIINDLRPHVLDLGLGAAVEWQIADFRRRTGIECELIGGHLDLSIVDDICATSIFRILQESLNNVGRHAQASAVQVELKLEPGSPSLLSMRVTDNGIGMPSGPHQPGSFGLVGIAERINLLQGAFHVRSNPGGGTTLSLSVPLNNTRRAGVATEWPATGQCAL